MFQPEDRLQTFVDRTWERLCEEYPDPNNTQEGCAVFQWGRGLGDITLAETAQILRTSEDREVLRTVMLLSILMWTEVYTEFQYTLIGILCQNSALALRLFLDNPHLTDDQDHMLIQAFQFTMPLAFEQYSAGELTRAKDTEHG